MKTKKLLSIILTLCLIFTTIGSITVVNAADEVVVNVAQGAPCTLADGTVVDTTYPGFQIINGTDGNIYRVNVGTYGVLLYDDMESHYTTMNADGTGTNSFGTAFGCTISASGAAVYDVTTDKGTSSTKSLKFIEENSNTFISIGNEASQYTDWVKSGSANTGRRISFKLKIADFNHKNARKGENQVVAIRADGQDWLLIRLYPQVSNNATVGFNMFCVKTYTTGSVNDIEIKPSNKYGIAFDITEDTVTTSWINFEGIFDAESKNYDIYINGISAATDVPFDKNIYSDGINKISPAKRTTPTHEGQVYLDDFKITDNILVYPSAINGTGLTDSIYSGAKGGKVSVPVTMSDGTTQNFTANYELTPAQTATVGTYTVEAEIPGFTEKVNVAVTVLESSAKDKTINSYIGDVLTLPTEFDSTSVVWKNYAGNTVTSADTTSVGRKYYTGTVADGRTVKYTVNIGKYDSGIGDAMENHIYKEITVDSQTIPSLSPVTSDGFRLSLGTGSASEPGSLTVKSETVDGKENQYVVIGPEMTKSDYAMWSIYEDGFTGGFKLSFRIKVEEHAYENNKNGIKINMLNTAGKEMGYIYLQMAYKLGHAENFLRAYGGATTANTSLNDYIKSDNNGVTAYSDWMDIEIHGGINSYDAYLNGNKFVDDMPYSNGCVGGDIAKICMGKRNKKTEYNSVLALDDLRVSRYICYTGELPQLLNITTAVGDNSAQIPLVYGNGSSNNVDVTINADVSKIANLSNVDATIAGFDGTVKANVKVCNYNVDGVNLKNGSEFVTAPVAGGNVESAKITRLTNAAASQAIFVLYSQNDEIKAIKATDISGLVKDVETVIPVGMTLPENTAAGDYIRVYVWDSKTNLAPLDMVTDINFNYGVAPAIYFAGDSTACNYSYTGTLTQWPKTGVGQIFSDYYTGNVTNLAKSGATTQTFINDGLWGRIIDNINTGDYVVISFGHNDQDYCLTEPCFYKTNLQKFIDDARAEGANVLMYSPITRRGQEVNPNRFEPAGDHKTHMADLEKICTDNSVPFIDMEDKSVAYIKGLTASESAHLYMIDLVESQDKYKSHSNWTTSRYNPAGKNDVAGYSNDNTHFTVYGAKVYAQMLANAIKEQYPNIQLSNYLIKLNNELTYPALD